MRPSSSYTAIVASAAAQASAWLLYVRPPGNGRSLNASAIVRLSPTAPSGTYALVMPLASFNGTSPEMAALARFFRQEGLFTLVRWNYFFTNPPLTISEDQLREAFGIIDRGLAITDQAVS